MHTEHFIPGKDASLESSIATMQAKLAALGFHIEERSWLNPVEGVWSVHIRDRDCPLLFTNGKGASKLAALASALGEFFERLSLQLFLDALSIWARRSPSARFAHYPHERWFQPGDDGDWPEELLTPELHAFYNPEDSIARRHAGRPQFRQRRARHLRPALHRASATADRVWFPVNIIGNLYVSNGMSAGNTLTEARTQALSEIFERHIKFRIISEGPVPARRAGRGDRPLSAHRRRHPRPARGGLRHPGQGRLARRRNIR